MKNFKFFTAIAFSVAGISTSLPSYGLMARYNMFLFSNFGENAPLFETEKESASCMIDMAYGNHNIAIPPGETTKKPYYEKWEKDNCFYETKQLSWIITASRAADNFRWQCRLRLTTRYDEYQYNWQTKVDIESLTPGAPDLCTDGTLFKSITCTDTMGEGKSDCLNQYSWYLGRIQVILGSPPLAQPGVPQSVTPNRVQHFN